MPHRLPMQTMIDHYFEGSDPPPPIPDEPDLIGRGAVMALANIVDGNAKQEDLNAYRAWITKLRFDGIHEDDLSTALAVAHDLARRLGVP